MKTRQSYNVEKAGQSGRHVDEMRRPGSGCMRAFRELFVVLPNLPIQPIVMSRTLYQFAETGFEPLKIVPKTHY